MLKVEALGTEKLKEILKIIIEVIIVFRNKFIFINAFKKFQQE
jgi:hypothetical protein